LNDEVKKDEVARAYSMNVKEEEFMKDIDLKARRERPL
jgi:hypothetical protein